MGVKASLSIAIVDSLGELWGLVALHSYSEAVIPSIDERIFYGMMSSVISGPR